MEITINFKVIFRRELEENEISEIQKKILDRYLENIKSSNYGKKDALVDLSFKFNDNNDKDNKVKINDFCQKIAEEIKGIDESIIKNVTFVKSDLW